MLDAMESLLARWTGRTSWPTTTAKLENRLIQSSIGAGRGGLAACDFYSYEVDGQLFVSSVREIVGKGNVMGDVGNSIPIRYNPRKPSQSYYAPACQLASRLIVAAVVLCAAMAIAFCVYQNRPQG